MFLRTLCCFEEEDGGGKEGVIFLEEEDDEDIGLCFLVTWKYDAMDRLAELLPQLLLLPLPIISSLHCVIITSSTAASPPVPPQT